MRTVHEPEQPRGGGATNESTPPGKRNHKGLRVTNGVGAAKPVPSPRELGPSEDEDGNPVTPSAILDNITYIPAHHPITGQPGFMIHYPPDIQFTSWESSIPADHLMRLLRRQLHWAEREKAELKRENEMLEQERHNERLLKEILLEGAMEVELARADRDQLLRDVDEHVRQAMEKDVEPSKKIPWIPRAPHFRRVGFRSRLTSQPSGDTAMPDAGTSTPVPEHGSPSPPPTGKSGGFDGDQDPYDNYVGDRMAEFERLRAEREKAKSLQNTPSGKEQQADAEADAVGALMGMSGH
jgi:hypothetical protein